MTYSRVSEYGAICRRKSQFGPKCRPISNAANPGGLCTYANLTGHEQWTFDSNGLILESLGHYDDEDYHRQLIVTAE